MSNPQRVRDVRMLCRIRDEATEEGVNVIQQLRSVGQLV